MNGRDRAADLLRALRRTGGVPFTPLLVESRGWSSATFCGERVTLRLRCDADPRLPTWLETLAEAELPMRGCYVADLCVRDVECGADGATLVLDALVLESL